MTSEAPAGRRAARWVPLVLVLALLAVAAALLARDLRRADLALQRARSTAPALAQALKDGDGQKARQVLKGVQDDTAAARGATDGPLWDLAVHAPWVGRTLRTTRAVSRSADGAVTGIAPPLLDALELVRAAHRGGGRIDLTAVRRTAPQLQTALGRTRRELGTLDRSPRALVWPEVADARQELLDKLDELARTLTTLSEGTGVLPAMLGDHGSRTYLLAFQNNAEVRGTGGLLGGFGLLRLDHGRARVLHVGSDLELDSLPAPQVRLDPDFAHLWGHDLTAWQNANLSADFPHVATLWLDMWLRHTGQRLDGVLSADPTALARLLEVTGPVAVPGGAPVSAADVVARTESEAYQVFEGAGVRRKDYLVRIGEVVLAKLLGTSGPSLSALARPVLAATETRSVMAYSAHSAEQQWLAGTPLGGEVPDEPGPFAFLVVNNTAGNKLDYYLDREVGYRLGSCAGGRRTTTVRAQLTVDVPSSPLPPIVIGRLDRKGRPARSTSLLVSWYVARGATLDRAEVDGRRVAVYPGTERGHPVFSLRVELLARQPKVVTLQLSEPVSAASPVVPEQSLARRQRTTVSSVACR
ncbi:MAG TPA: DUF4012 domain-containing protein [Mycobacteriales bacterium]|nr:DUF4012 domain-containing protein [Mycobacteriales bacterium]